MLMYEMNVDTALLFYTLCERLKADTEEKRVAVMNYLAEKGLVNSVMYTDRTADQVAKDMAKNFGNVLYVKGKKKKGKLK